MQHCFAAESESRIVGQGQDISKVGGVSGKIKKWIKLFKWIKKKKKIAETKFSDDMRISEYKISPEINISTGEYIMYKNIRAGAYLFFSLVLYMYSKW